MIEIGRIGEIVLEDDVWMIAFHGIMCYSAARQEAFAHRIVFVEIKQRFLDGLLRAGSRISFHLASFTSRSRSSGSYPSLTRLDHPLTFIQDEGKEKKRGGRRKRVKID